MFLLEIVTNGQGKAKSLAKEGDYKSVLVVSNHRIIDDRTRLCLCNDPMGANRKIRKHYAAIS